MKKLFSLFLFFLLLPVFIFAQSLGSLNIFSENGDKFYVFLDGKKQNDIARSNIRIQELPDLFYSAKIVFEDASIAPISKNNLYVSDGDDMMRDASYRIRREKDSKPKLSFYSMLPVQQNFVPGADMYVFHFGKPSSFETLPVVEKKELPLVAAAEKPLGSLNVFSQNADKFYLFLDGVKQNDVAQSNIRISNIPGLYYNIRIVFKDPKIAPIIKNNVFISDGDDNLMDAAYRIRRDNTGKPRFNFYSMTAIKENFVAPTGMWVHNLEKGAVAGSTAVTESKSKQTVSSIKGTITNIKVTEAVSPSSRSTAKSSTKNTTNTVAEKSKPAADPVIAANKPVEASNKTSEANKTIPENKKCNGWPMGKGDLAAGKKLIEQAATEEEKLTAAQDFIISNCLTTSQVTEFCSMFKSEKSKLAFAKYAYKFTIDRKNYAEVNKALSLEKSKKELNKFVNGG